nr:hypothetical protein [Tanacetum cinerariifolium]
VPFHNLKFSNSDDPPLGVYISSRLPVNRIPIELFTFHPPVRHFPEGVLVVVYGLLYPYLTGHQIFNPFDVPIICRLRLCNGRCIFTARCTSPKILEVDVDEVFKRNYPTTSIIRPLPSDTQAQSDLNMTPSLTRYASQRTMVELLRAPTEGYAEVIAVPSILAEQFQLKHRAARRWLEIEPPRSILTWKDLVSKFINEFFPPSRTTNLRNEISNFQQRFDELFHEAWDRYKDLLRACPHHGFTELHQLDTFYNALNLSDQDSLNSAAGGNLLERRTQDVLTIIENKSKVRNSRNKSVVSQVKSNDANFNSSSEIAKLTHAVNQQTSTVTTAMTTILKQFQAAPPPASVKAVEEICVTCGGAHPYYQCSGSLPINTIANPKGELKAITTRSGIVLDGPSIPIPPLFINPEEDERVEETLTDQDLAEYTIKVPPPLVQKPKPPSQRNFVVHQRDPLHSNIPYPSRVGFLNKLLEKLGDPGKFLMCGFSELKCKALVDLGASINLMPLSIWKKLEGGNVPPEKLLDLDSIKDLHLPHHINPLSDSTTSSSSTKHLLEEFANELALITFPPEYDDDLTLISNVLDYSSPLLYDEYDDDLFKDGSDAEYVYDDPFDSKGEKIKESKLLIGELDLPSDFLPSSEYDSFFSKDFSKVDAFPSTNNEDKNANKLAISHASLILEDFDPPLYELSFFKKVPRSKTLLSFSSENEEKVFKPGILTSKEVHSFLIPELSHQGYEVFKINQILKSPMKIFLFFRGENIPILDVPCLTFYPP